MKNPASITGKYLSGELKIPVPNTRREPQGWLTVVGAKENNLKNITVNFPKGMKAPEGAEWNYFESAFINGEVALQVHEDYFAGSLANMEDDYGFVFFPKGPRAETYLYAPSDNIMVIPACYDADRAWKIAFAYNLFTNPTPGYTDSDDWKNGYYQKYRDERAVDETITMMREPEHQFVWYSDMVTGYDLGSQYIWDVYAQATTPAEKAESMRGTWQAYIDEANAN